MKVLKEGKGYLLEVTCTGKGNGGAGCGAVLGVSKEDVYMTESYDYGGGHDIYYTIRCPRCGTETDISIDKLPDSVKRYARRFY